MHYAKRPYFKFPFAHCPYTICPYAESPNANINIPNVIHHANMANFIATNAALPTVI
jgi:hypothetical protein